MRSHERPPVQHFLRSRHAAAAWRCSCVRHDGSACVRAADCRFHLRYKQGCGLEPEQKRWAGAQCRGEGKREKGDLYASSLSCPRVCRIRCAGDCGGRSITRSAHRRTRRRRPPRQLASQSTPLPSERADEEVLIIWTVAHDHLGHDEHGIEYAECLEVEVVGKRVPDGCHPNHVQLLCDQSARARSLSVLRWYMPSSDVCSMCSMGCSPQQCVVSISPTLTVARPRTSTLTRMRP